MNRASLKFGDIDSDLRKNSLTIFSLYLLLFALGHFINLFTREWDSQIVEIADIVTILSAIVLFSLFLGSKINIQISTTIFSYVFTCNLIISDLLIIYNRIPEWQSLIYRDAFLCAISIIASGILSYRSTVILQCVIYQLILTTIAILSPDRLFLLRIFWPILLLVFCFSLSALHYKDNILTILNKRIKMQQEINKRDWQLHLKEVEIIKNQTEYLRQTVQFKDRELTSYALLIAQNNEKNKTLLKDIEALNSFTKDRLPKGKIKEIKVKLLEYKDPRTWERFQKQFEEVHSNFYKKLAEKCPALSPTELKLAALIKLGLTSKEIASITYNTKASIDVARSRLRKKLELDRSENIEYFLLNL